MSNKSNRFPMNNSAFVFSDGCVETSSSSSSSSFLVFIPSWQSTRQGGFTRVDRVVFVDIFVSRPVGYVRACNLHRLCVCASVALGYANVSLGKLASFVSHLRHADASKCLALSKLFLRFLFFLSFLFFSPFCFWFWTSVFSLLFRVASTARLLATTLG